MSLSLSIAELAGIVGAAVALAVTDGAALSRLAVAWIAKRLGVEPGEVTKYQRATEDE